MATWEIVSLDSLRAASVLLNEDRPRSCISRSYYAAYSAVVSELMQIKGIKFTRGRGNPSHEQLIKLLTNHPKKGRSLDTLKRVKKSLRSLRRAREVADYMPGQHIDKGLAHDLIHDAAFVTHIFGVKP